MTRRTPELLLEQLRRGELSPEQAQALRARLAEEPGGLDRLAALEASDAEILERYPPRVVAAALRQRLARRRRVGIGLAGLALAAGLAALSLRPEAPTLGALDPIEEGVRLKGLDPRLQLHRLGPDGEVEALMDGDPAQAGDRLQLGYIAAGEAYGAVLSVDGRGVVTRHLPHGGELAAALEGGGAHALPESYELDDAPDFERFLLVVGERPFALGPVLEAVEGLPADAPLVLPEPLSAVSLTLVKE
ncbi:MAG: ActD-like protein [Alphaproteobacteria bacterium]|nr:ActD-like protein [Alphaproteobacteria bacterium]